MKTGGQQGKSQSRKSFLGSFSRIAFLKPLSKPLTRGYSMTERDVPKVEDGKE